MDQLVVRRIVTSDGPLLQRVRLEALLDAPGAFGSTYEAESTRTPEDWSAWARDRSSGGRDAMFFAFYDGDAVGLAGGFFPDGADGTTADLFSMWVRADQRGTPAAAGLVAAVHRWAADTGADAVELWVVRGNGRAESFYRRCGYRPTGGVAPVPSDPRSEELRMRAELG